MPFAADRLRRKAHERSNLHVRSAGSGRTLAQQAQEGRCTSCKHGTAKCGGPTATVPRATFAGDTCATTPTVDAQKPRYARDSRGKPALRPGSNSASKQSTKRTEEAPNEQTRLPRTVPKTNPRKREQIRSDIISMISLSSYLDYLYLIFEI